MLTIKEAIVVEGRYDAIKLASIVDTVIVQTGGFRIFKDQAQMALLRTLASTRGLVVLTDVDAAGFLIRDHIGAAIPKEQIKHAYIPPIIGKERRKDTASKEGLLGVEGMEDATIIAALKTAGVDVGGGVSIQPPYLTKARLFEDGLTGGADSRQKRLRLCEKLGLPTHLSTARLMAVLNAAFSEEAYQAAISD